MLLSSQFNQQLQQEIAIYPPAVPPLSSLPPVSPASDVKCAKYWRACFYAWEQYKAQWNNLYYAGGTTSDATANLTKPEPNIYWDSTDHNLRAQIHGWDLIPEGDIKTSIKQIALELDYYSYQARLAFFNSGQSNAYFDAMAQASKRRAQLEGGPANGFNRGVAQGAQQVGQYYALNNGPLKNAQADWLAWWKSAAWQTEYAAFQQAQAKARIDAYFASIEHGFEFVTARFIVEMKIALGIVAIAFVAFSAPIIAGALGVSTTAVAGVETAGIAIAQGAKVETIITPAIALGADVGKNLGGDMGLFDGISTVGNSLYNEVKNTNLNDIGSTIANVNAAEIGQGIKELTPADLQQAGAAISSAPPAKSQATASSVPATLKAVAAPAGIIAMLVVAYFVFKG